MRTQPRSIWELIGDRVKSPHQIMEEILLHENQELYEKDDFSTRMSRQMELPIELAGSSIENPRDLMNPALLGGISLAYQGFPTFLPEHEKVLQIDWDGSDLPAFKGIQSAFRSKLIKSEVLREMWCLQLQLVVFYLT